MVPTDGPTMLTETEIAKVESEAPRERIPPLFFHNMRASKERIELLRARLTGRNQTARNGSRKPTGKEPSQELYMEQLAIARVFTFFIREISLPDTMQGWAADDGIAEYGNIFADMRKLPTVGSKIFPSASLAIDDDASSYSDDDWLRDMAPRSLQCRMSQSWTRQNQMRISIEAWEADDSSGGWYNALTDFLKRAGHQLINASLSATADSHWSMATNSS